MRALRIRRLPAAWWLLALGLAVATGALVAGFVGEAEARARRWGAVADVPVATRAIAAGEVVGSADVARVRLPRRMIPDSPVVPSPEGRAAAVAILPGEVLVEAKLAPWGLHGLAALLPAGHRAVAVPTGDGETPPLRRGDRVDVLATVPAEVAGDGPPTFTVARRALVLDTGDDAVTIAVRAEDVARVTYGVTQGVVTLVLTT